MPTLSNLNIELGREFTEVEDAHSSHVAIVGSDIVDNLLGPGDPLGKEIRVDGSPYTVIGVGERQGKTLGQSMDNWVAVPLTAFLQSHGSHSTLGGEVMDAVSDELRTIMRIRRHLAPNAIDTFTIDTSATFQNLLGKILNSFGAVVAAIAGISLVIGGIVIMNIMLVSVTERTREIGLMKALGARRRDILAQFLMESLVLTFLAGLVGVIVSIVTTYLVPPMPLYSALYKTANHDGDIILRASAGIMLASFVILTLVGIVSGLLPAIRAAKMDPVVALRHE